MNNNNLNSQELKEKLQHGSNSFPFAKYRWQGGFDNAVNLHWHPELEIIKCIKGNINLTINLQPISIKEPCYIIIPGNILHSLFLPKDSVEDAIVFNINMLSFINYDTIQAKVFYNLASGNMPILPIIYTNNKLFNLIDPLFNFICSFQIQQDFDELIIKIKLLEIIYLLYKHEVFAEVNENIKINSSNQDKLKVILDYINQHYSGPISLTDLASKINVSEQYFCRFFKKSLNTSFIEYLNNFRLNKITKELITTNKTIIDIAFDHGFENISYFYKLFKKKYNQSPKEFRLKHQTT